MRSKGALDLVSFVEHLETLKDDSAKCLSTVINDCVLPWLQEEEGIDITEDPSENGKQEDFTLLMGMTKPNQTVEQFLCEIETLSGSEKGDSTNAVHIGTFHWSKGAESPNVIVNTTRCPIVPPAPKRGQLPTGKPPTIEEERRLVFVGVSRAKEKCVVVGSQQWNGHNCPTSQFVKELGLLDKDNENA
jgi:superfamily I DNA/RNA helicase